MIGRRRPRRRVLTVALALGLGGFCGEALAAPTDIRACASAYEQGQRLRKQGALRAAREEVVLCASDSCPAALRDDCMQWLREIERALPTVVLVARARGEP